MSAQLSQARKNLTMIPTRIKQKKVTLAVQIFADGVKAVVQNAMMSREQREFEDLILNGVHALRNSRDFVQVYPLSINYKIGEEKALYVQLMEALRIIREEEDKQARALLESMPEKEAPVDILAGKTREQALAECQTHLKNGEVDLARNIADELIDRNPDETKLRVLIAELFSNAGYPEDAIRYLKNALRNDPNAVHIFSRIAVNLRKMAKYEMSLKFFKKAVRVTEVDEHLFFNLGRLFIDWGKWPEAVQMAERCVGLNPDFAEGKKMLKFARKRAGSMS